MSDNSGLWLLGSIVILPLAWWAKRRDDMEKKEKIKLKIESHIPDFFLHIDEEFWSDISGVLVVDAVNRRINAADVLDNKFLSCNFNDIRLIDASKYSSPHALCSIYAGVEGEMVMEPTIEVWIFKKDVGRLKHCVNNFIPGKGKFKR
jgi:hypothetical protein